MDNIQEDTDLFTDLSEEESAKVSGGCWYYRRRYYGDYYSGCGYGYYRPYYGYYRYYW
jgi:hypothetical protein